MNRIEHADRKLVVQLYYEMKSPVLVQRAFKAQTNRKAPSRWTIMRIVATFNTHGNVQRMDYHRNPTVRTSTVIASVAAAIDNNPTISTRQLALNTAVSRRSISRILHEDLNLFPYKIQITSSLNQEDPPIRLEFCQKTLCIVEKDANFINCLFMSDEAHFDLNGNVNKQNCRIWAEGNPQNIHPVMLHAERVTVWCAVSVNCIVGPYFFEENNASVTVNGERYLYMLQQFFSQKCADEGYLSEIHGFNKMELVVT